MTYIVITETLFIVFLLITSTRLIVKLKRKIKYSEYELNQTYENLNNYRDKYSTAQIVINTLKKTATGNQFQALRKEAKKGVNYDYLSESSKSVYSDFFIL